MKPVIAKTAILGAVFVLTILVAVTIIVSSVMEDADHMVECIQQGKVAAITLDGDRVCVVLP